MKVKTPRATDAQTRRRVEELLRIRLDGAELWDIREYVREKVAAKDSVWGETLLSDSQIYRYLERVDALLAESCKGGRKRLFRRHLAYRRNLYARTVNAGDYRTALSVLRDEADLLSLYPRPEDELRKDVDDLKKQLAELESHGHGILAGGHCPAQAVDPGTGGADGATAVAAASGPEPAPD